MDEVTSGLATRLRLETQALHVEAERSGYVQAILKRRASQEGYALYLRNLQPAYDALERALSTHAARPALSPFRWPDLFRSEAIANDLTALAGRYWETALPRLSASEAYARRVREVEAADPDRLIGHAYVRYIGDLSGGQIVKALLSKHPGLQQDMLGFYDFPAIPDAEIFKDGFRAALDGAGVMTANADAIVDEALAAFRLNIDLSLAVERAVSSAGPD